jgi:hypothetical protein
VEAAGDRMAASRWDRPACRICGGAEVFRTRVAVDHKRGDAHGAGVTSTIWIASYVALSTVVAVLVLASFAVYRNAPIVSNDTATM